MKMVLFELQKFPTFACWKIISKGTTFHLGRSSNSQQDINYKFRDPNTVVFGLNFKGVQTLEENFCKFTKNLS
jgi:hypothetical protein